MTFENGVKRAGFFKNNIFKKPLKSFDQIQNLMDEMPAYILNELREYIEMRQKDIVLMREEELDENSLQKKFQQNYMGKHFKATAEQEQTIEEDNDQMMNFLQEMDQIGRQDLKVRKHDASKKRENSEEKNQ